MNKIERPQAAFEQLQHSIESKKAGFADYKEDEHDLTVVLGNNYQHVYSLPYELVSLISEDEATQLSKIIVDKSNKFLNSRGLKPIDDTSPEDIVSHERKHILKVKKILEQKGLWIEPYTLLPCYIHLSRLITNKGRGQYDLEGSSSIPNDLIDVFTIEELVDILLAPDCPSQGDYLEIARVAEKYTLTAIERENQNLIGVNGGITFEAKSLLNSTIRKLVLKRGSEDSDELINLLQIYRNKLNQLDFPPKRNII